MSSVFYNTDDAYKSGNPLLEEHIGVVIDNSDPLNLCRIRVYIPKLLNHDNISWISRVAPTFPGFTYSVPKLGQKIRVWFRNNNIMDGVYGLDYTHVDSNMRQYEFKPNEYGFVDDCGNKVKFSDSSLTLKTDLINIEAKNFNVSGSILAGDGYTGSFSTGDGKIVTVQGGIIINVT